jgi:hypothetical protein
MSALTDRIAEVLREHASMDAGTWCRCGQAFDRRDARGQAEHVAERIEAELFTEETCICDETTPPVGTYRRWVSAWTEVDQ